MELTTEMVDVDADAGTKKRKGLSLSRAYVYYHERPRRKYDDLSVSSGIFASQQN